MTNTDKAVALFRENPGRKFHSKELNEILGWDFRKYVSNARKILGEKLKTNPAEKHFNFYWLDQGAGNAYEQIQRIRQAEEAKNVSKMGTSINQNTLF